MKQITLPEATETRQGDEQLSPALFPVSQTLILQDPENDSSRSHDRKHDKKRDFLVATKLSLHPMQEKFRF